MMNSYFYFWGLTSEYPKSLTQLSHAYTTHLQKNSLDMKPWMISLAESALHMLLYIRKIKCIYATPLGKVTQKMTPGFSWNLSHAPFSFAGLNPFCYNKQ